MLNNLQDLIQFSNSNNFTSEFQNSNWTADIFQFQTDLLKQLTHTARDKGHYTANIIKKQLEKVFHLQKLNPNDAKVIFHPVDYFAFNGMKENKTEGVNNIVLLDGEKRTTEGKKIQKSIMKAGDNGNYKWIMLRIENDGGIKEE